MARKTKYITIEDDNRDNGKTFLITEMPASQAEKWGAKALLALTTAGAEIPDDVEGAGMAGLARMGIEALTTLRYDDVAPLMDEMFACVQICPDRRNHQVFRRLEEDDIEEVVTRLKLRKEILALHIDFFTEGNRSGPSQTHQPDNPGVSRITRTSQAR
ncbi:hypothetical protein [Methylobacterium currus]|uniref:hypothetical protein n=1 Tax=Methylobacterium currus TaxID=2051553 RepID=UPI001FD094C0|nr:hypothetical protein [Methylobacterium currus]